jgi:putative membrane protein
MKIASYIGLIVGLAVMTGLIAWQGVAEISGLLLRTGWPLLLVPLIWAPTMFMNARCWQLLFHADHQPRFWPALYAQWMGRAVNTLLPVATIGGEVVKARALVLWGTDARHASASAVVDKTVQVVTVILWAVVGVSLLTWTSLDNTLAISGAIGVAVLGAGTAGFLVVQRAGMFRLMATSAHKVTKSDFIGSLVERAHEIDQMIHALYRSHRRLAAATLWRFAALVLQTGEVWLAAHLLGHPITVLEAMLLKSLSSTLSDAAFVVPNSYGVQEGAFIVVGALVGMPPEVALAVSLAIRIREIVFDVPGLVFWQHMEGRALVRRRRAARESTGGADISLSSSDGSATSSEATPARDSTALKSGNP